MHGRSADHVSVPIGDFGAQRSWMTRGKRLAIVVICVIALFLFAFPGSAINTQHGSPQAPRARDLSDAGGGTGPLELQLQSALQRLESENVALQHVIDRETEHLRHLQQQVHDGGASPGGADQHQPHVDHPQHEPQGEQAADVHPPQQHQQRQHQQQQQQQQPQEQGVRHAGGPAPVSSNGPHGLHVPTEAELNERQRAVIDAFKWAWKGYKEHAWGHDELLPVSQSHSEWFGLGLTLVDALDTMYLMGLSEEYKEARDWVEHGLNLDKNVDVNLFECTIRVLGGLLSCYALTKDPLYRDKAIDLGHRLQHAFNDNSGVPFSDVNLHTGVAHKPRWGPDSSTAEVSTIQIEFKYLAHISNDPSFHDRVTQIMEHLRSLPKTDGLVPIFVNANTGRFSGNTITLGARGDSYYEYLLKQWLITGKQETVYKDMYLEAVEGIKKHLLKRTEKENLLYVAELINNKISPKMDHLVCFLPGTLALGAYHGLPQEHLDIAKELLRTCYEMYARQPLGLAPEITHFNMGPHREDLYVKPADAHNLLRPETIESLFILHRITGDKQYQEWGWNIFNHFEKHCKVSTGGYSSLKSVLTATPAFRDKMESFFLGETLKYFFLLFSDAEIVPLDKWVFNTEAHPLPIFTHN